MLNLAHLCGTGTTGCHAAVHGRPKKAVEDGWTVPGQIVRSVYTGPNVEYRAAYPETT